MITAKINVSSIDKTKLFKGNKGVYLDICLIETPNSEYGDFMVVQSSTKEERDAGKRGAILGNAKVFGERRQAPAQRPAATHQPVHQPVATPKNDYDDDVPF